jgi:hypothetical protein
MSFVLVCSSFPLSKRVNFVLRFNFFHHPCAEFVLVTGISGAYKNGCVAFSRSSSIAESLCHGMAWHGRIRDPRESCVALKHLAEFSCYRIRYLDLLDAVLTCMVQSVP